MRLTQQIWWLMYDVEQARRSHRQLEAGTLDDEDLDAEQSIRVRFYDENIEGLDQLRKKHVPAYRGSWAHCGTWEGSAEQSALRQLC